MSDETPGIQEPLMTVATEIRPTSEIEPPVTKKSSRIGQPLLRFTQAIWVLALIAFTWSTESPSEGHGIDQGTIVGLHWWRALGLDYANQFHTHGPLDYLFHPKAMNTASIVLPLVFLLLVNSAMIAVFYKCMRKYANRLVAMAVTTVAIFLLSFRDQFMLEFAFVLLLGLAVLVIQSEKFRYKAEVFAAIAGLALFIKLAFSLMAIFSTIVIFVLLSRNIKTALRCVGIFAGTLIAIWAYFGEWPWTLVSWLTKLPLLASGYTHSFGTEQVAMDMFFMAFAVASALVLLLLNKGITAKRVAIFLIAEATIYLIVKESITRSDNVHTILLFTVLPVLLCMIPAQSIRPAVAILMTSVFLVTFFYHKPVGMYPDASYARFKETVSYALSGSSLNKARQEYLDHAHSYYKMPQSIRDALGQHPVSLEGDDPLIAWAYGLNWKPDPLWQRNLAYMPKLDKLNADSLMEKKSYVLWEGERAIEGRIAFHDNPSWYYSLLCNYRVKASENGWQVFESLPASRCGTPTKIASVTLKSDTDNVEVPKVTDDHTAIYASINETPLPLPTKLLHQVSKYSNRPYEVIDQPWALHPLTTATSKGNLLYRIPSSSGWTNTYGFSGNTMTNLSFRNVNYPTTIDFYKVTVND